MGHNKVRAKRWLGASLQLAVFLFLCGCGIQPDNQLQHAKVYGGPPQPDVAIQAMPNRLQYDGGVPVERSKALNESVSSIYTLLNNSKPDATVDPILMQMMKLPDLQASSLQAWLELRIHYVVNDDFDMAHRTHFENQVLRYPYPDDVPDAIIADGGAVHPSPSNVTNENASGSLIMLNTGTSVYFDGKQRKSLAFILMDGIGNVPLVSPRTGLLEIGSGMFPALNGQPVQNIFLDIFRVAVLFHEARHSDGHGKALGFMHAKCPVGSDYAGIAACDAATNGAYTVGALVLKKLALACGDSCTVATQHALQLIYYDIVDRTLNSYQLPNASPESPAGKDWDDAPESLN